MNNQPTHSRSGFDGFDQHRLPPSTATRKSCLEIYQNVTTRCDFQAQNAQTCVISRGFTLDGD